jgi:hypothetical protein
MTVTVQIPFTEYVAAPGATTFATTFRLIELGDLLVTVNGAIVTSGFAVGGLPIGPTASVVFAVPMVGGEAIKLERVIKLERQNNYQFEGDFQANVVNEDFDRLWMSQQDQKQAIDNNLATQATVNARTLRAPLGEVLNELPSAAVRANKVQAFNSSGQPIAVLPGNGTASEVLINLAGTGAGQGDALIGVIAAESGAVPTTQRVLNRLALHAGAHFGVVGDGVANDTVKMKAFWDACIASGKRGFISAGNYLITPGVLVFDNGHVDTPAPHIETSEGVKFTAATSADQPFITYSNGTAVSGAGNYWQGGYLGSIEFIKGSAGGITSNCHGVSLRGVEKMQFGDMLGTNIGGSTVYCPLFLYNGFNPDPYAVFGCNFKSILGIRNKRFAFENQNFVGFNFNTIGFVRAIETGLGGFYGFGAANTVESASIGECMGWAFDDGTSLVNTGGSPSRFNIGFAEIDGCENGIRLNRLTLSALRGVRFVHRYKFPPNTTNVYWPLACWDVAGGASSNISQVLCESVHRVESAMGALLGLIVGPNPLSVTSGSNVVTVNTTNPHTFTSGWTVAMLNAAATGGIPAVELNGEKIITVVTANQYTFTTTTAATSTTTGGGTTITLSPYSALGHFADLHNSSSFTGLSIDQLEINNAGFTSLTNDQARLYSNLSSNAVGVSLTRASKVIGRASIDPRASVRGSANLIIKTSANAAAPADTCNFNYDSELLDRAGLYDLSISKFLVPYFGTWRVCARFMLTAPVGTAVKIYIIRTRAAVNSVVSEVTAYQVNAGPQTYFIDDMTEFAKGDLIFIGGSQNTASNIVATAAISQEASNKVTFEPVYG